MIKVPFNIPYIGKNAIKNVKEVLNSRHQQGDGPFSLQSEKLITEIDGPGLTKLVPSCTSALEIASMLINLQRDDEVILPDYTFTSAAIAITKFASKPVFVDIDKETKCIDADLIEEKITSKTRAISWVNYAGATPDFGKLKTLAKKYNLYLIEDNAHSFGVKGNSITGDFVTQSFHATKNIQCGEGGSIKLNTLASCLTSNLEEIREKGTNRSDFLRNATKKYEWTNEGGSYLMPEICSAVLLDQLKNFDEIQSMRQHVFSAYMNDLSEILDKKGYVWSKLQSHKNTSHMFYIDFLNRGVADSFIEKCQSKGIQVNRHYQSLSNSKYGSKFIFNLTGFPNSRSASESLVRLPIYPKLVARCTDIARVIQKILKEID